MISWSLPEDVEGKVACNLGKHEYEPDGTPTYTDVDKIQKLKCKHCEHEKLETTKNQLDPTKGANIIVDSFGQLTGTQHVIGSSLTGTQHVIGGSGGVGVNIGAITVPKPTNPQANQLLADGIVAKQIETNELYIDNKNVKQQLESHNQRILSLEAQLKLATILIENLCQQKKLSDSSNTSKFGSQMTELLSEQKLTNS